MSKATPLAELVIKRTEGWHTYDLMDGETVVGEIAPVVFGAHDTPTGWFSYELPNFYPSGKSFINWHAGRTPREAAIKLAHKAGYK